MGQLGKIRIDIQKQTGYNKRICRELHFPCLRGSWGTAPTENFHLCKEEVFFMKRTKRTCLTRILVLVLVVAMLTPTTLAAGSGFGLSSWFQGVWDRFVGWFQPVQPEVPEEPEVPAAELTVVESPDTVDNGDALRASTYAVNNAAEIEAAGGRAVQNIRYFDVTLFDYDTDTINDKTHELEYEANSNLTEWAGLYFNNGNPEAAKYPSYADNYAEVRIQSTETDLDQYCDSVYYYYAYGRYIPVPTFRIETTYGLLIGGIGNMARI